jgi:hypothetical protein
MVNRRAISEERRGRTVLVHGVKIPPVESLDCLYVGRSFGVGVRGGGGWGLGVCRGVAIDLGTLGQKGELKAQSRQTLLIGKEYLIERDRERQREKAKRGERRRIPSRAVNRTRLNLSPVLYGFPFTRKETSSTILKKEEENMSSTGLCSSVPFHHQSEPPVAPSSSVKNKNKNNKKREIRSVVMRKRREAREAT